MHGIRDNKVSLQAGHHVIVISPLEGASQIFHDRFWKSDHDFLIVITGNFFMCDAWFPRIWASIASRIWRHRDYATRGASGNFSRRILKERPWLPDCVKHPWISEWHISHPLKGFPNTRPRLLSYCARKLVHQHGMQLNWRKKNKQNTKKVTRPYMLHPRGVSTVHRTRTNFVRAGDLPYVITHAKFEIDCYKSVILAKGWTFVF